MTPNESSPFPTSQSPMSQSSGVGSDGTPSGSGASAAARSNAAAQADSVIQRVAQGAHEAVDRLAERAGPTFGHVYEMQDEWVENCRTTIRENPFASIAVAVVAGMLLSRILSSR